MLKRLFDLLFALTGLVLISPLLCILILVVALDGKGGIFYRQIRVGRFGKDFYLLKFRTMHPNSEQKGLLTIGGRDPRVTRSGYYLRKYKLDELPQLINVIKGDMSLVGPRPEVRKYVDLYTEEQKKVLQVRPGITDYASIQYSNENELLAQTVDPEKIYIEEIMPSKLRLNQKYILKNNIGIDLKIIVQTILKIIS